MDSPTAEAAVAYAKKQGLISCKVMQSDAGLLPDVTLWMFGFASDHVAAPNAWVCGIVVGAVAIAALGVLSFSAQTTARWAHVGIWLIVAVLAGLWLWFMHQTPRQRVGAQR